MRYFIAILLALTGCVTDDELTDELTDELARTSDSTSPDETGTLECPPLPPTPPPHVDGDVVVAEPEELSDADWLEALSPGRGQSIQSRH
jgi:hypothetical protein